MHAVPRFLPYALIAVAGMGCEHQLMPTPNIYATGAYDLVDADAGAGQGSSTVDLLYATDRKRVATSDGSVQYGWKRSWSLAAGICSVEIGHDVGWERLADNSTRHDRDVPLPMRISSITEMARLQETPTALVLEDGLVRRDPEAIAERDALAASLTDLVRDRLAASPRNELLIYVHGFKSTFKDAAFVLASLHHFSRDIVPVLYTWPAGAPGWLQGYTRDRESGEFTVLHLKRFVRRLAAIPEVEKIHVVAHSRGTDVVVTALRELLIEERGAGRVAGETFKIANLVLVAPDLDLDVVSQRFMGEQLRNVTGSLTVYVSRDDRAIGIAEWLAISTRRIGRIQPDDMDEVLRERLSLVGNSAFIDVRLQSDATGHNYYHRIPAVSSDLLLLLRYGAQPGSPQRPLTPVFPGYWILDDPDYPAGPGQ